MALKLITGPTVEPVTLTEAKNQCRVDTTDEDTLLTSLIQAAREYAEDYTNRALCTQTWELVLDAWPTGNVIELPKPPLQSVTSIKYKDSSGAEHTWDAANYIIDTDSYLGRVVLDDNCSWPTEALYPAAAIRVRFVAGYGLAVAVPQNVKQALLLLIAHWYDHREAAEAVNLQEIPFAVKALLDMKRVIPI